MGRTLRLLFSTPAYTAAPSFGGPIQVFERLVEGLAADDSIAQLMPGRIRDGDRVARSEIAQPGERAQTLLSGIDVSTHHHRPGSSTRSSAEPVPADLLHFLRDRHIALVVHPDRLDCRVDPDRGDTQPDWAAHPGRNRAAVEHGGDTSASAAARSGPPAAAAL